MACYTETSLKPSLETVGKRADAFKKYLAGGVPVRTRVKIPFTSRKAFSNILCSSFKEEILSPYDITNAIATSTLTSSGAAIVVVNKQSLLCGVTHIKNTPVAASSSSQEVDWPMCYLKPDIFVWYCDPARVQLMCLVRCLNLCCLNFDHPV